MTINLTKNTVYGSLLDIEVYGADDQSGVVDLDSESMLGFITVEEPVVKINGCWVLESEIQQFEKERHIKWVNEMSDQRHKNKYGK